MTKVWKRSLSLFLAFVMVFGMIPVNAFAMEEELVEEFFEEEFIEEEVFEEEIFEEEFFEEEIFEEVVEETPEEPVELTVETSNEVAVADAQSDDKYVIWVNKGKENMGMQDVIDYGVHKAVLDAMGRDYSGYTVWYDGMDVSDPLFLAEQYENSSLKKEVEEFGYATFVVKSTAGEETVKIDFKDSRLSLKIEVPELISNETDKVAKDWEAEAVKAVKVTADDPTTDVVEKYDVAYTVETLNFESPDPMNEDSEGWVDVKVIFSKNNIEEYDLDGMEGLDKETAVVYKTYSVELKDARQVFTVTYKNADGTEVYSNKYLTNDKTPDAPAVNPIKPVGGQWAMTRDRYNLTWNPAVEDVVTGDVTYVAVWEPQINKDNDAYDDRDEKYTVTFVGTVYDEVVADFIDVIDGKSFPNVPYGYPLEDLEARIDKKSLTVGYNYLKWDVEPVGPVENPGEGLNNTITFTVVHTRNFTVEFKNNKGYVDFGLTEDVEKDGKVPNPVVKYDTHYFWDSYYVEKWIDEATGLEFDFNTAVNKNLVLKPVGFPDRNKNEKEDGVAEAFTYFKWVVEGETVHETDWLPENEGDQPTAAAYTEIPVVAGKIFHKWSDPKVDGNTVTFVAEFHTDSNKNGVVDANEQITVTAEDGKGTVTVETKSGSVYDSTKEIKITAKPVVKSGNSQTYVKSITVKSNEWTEAKTLDLTYAANTYIATATLVKPAGENKSVEVVVEFADTGFTMDPAASYVMTGEVDPAEVYEAAVTEPAVMPAGTEVQFRAREAEQILIPLAEVREIFENKPGHEDFQKLFDENYWKMVNENEEYLYNQTELWLGVDEKLTAVNEETGVAEILPEVDLDTFMDEWLAKMASDETSIGEMVTDITDLKDQLKNSNNINVHYFGSQNSELLRVSYEDNKQKISAEGNVAVTKDLKTLTIVAENREVEFGKTINLLDGVSVLDEKGNVINTTVVVTTVGDYTTVGKHEITLTVNAFDSYDTVTKKYTLTVKPAEGRISFADDQIVVSEGQAYADRLGITSNADYIHVIAGVDVNSADFKLEVPNKDMQLTARVKILIPEEILDLMKEAEESGVEFKLEDKKGATIDELKYMLTDEYGPKLAAAGVSEATIDGIVAKVDEVAKMGTINGKEPLVDLTFVDTDEEKANFYPTEIGVYMNLAVIIDSNYTQAQAQSLVLITPGVAIPDKGLTLVDADGADKGRVFGYTVGSDKLPLSVKENVPYQINYYGFTAEPSIYMSAEAPKQIGLYVAAAISEDGAASDAAVVVITPKQGEVSITNRIVGSDDGYHAPEIKANAAKTIISLEVDAGNRAVNAKVTLPQGAINLLKKLKIEINEGSDVSLQGFINKLGGANAALDQVMEKAKPTLLKLSLSEETIEKAVAHAKGYVEKLKTELQKLADLGTATLTFTSNNSYKKAGVYFYAAIVTDPEYIPAVDYGYMIIENSAFEVQDKTVTVDGEEHDLPPVNDAGRGYITLISNEDASELNLILDGDEEARVLAKLKAMGYDIDGKTTTVLTLKEKADAEKISAAVVSAIREKTAAKLEKLPGNLYEKALEELEQHMAPVTQKLINKLSAKIGLADETKLSVNGAKPSAVGKYEFYYVSYAVAHGSATLTIEDDFFRTNIVMGSDLTLMFYMDPARITASKGYAKMVHDNNDPENGGPVTTIANFGDKAYWNYEIDEDTGKVELIVNLRGLAGKQMADDVTIQLFDANDNPISPSYTTSLRNYAMTHINRDNDHPFSIAMVDMLNYGAAAQKRFGYNTGDLANNKLTTVQKTFASEIGEYNDIKVVDKTYHAGTALRFNDKINLIHFFETSIGGGSYAVFTWTDHYNHAKEEKVTYKVDTTDNRPLITAELNGLVVADARQKVTCTVYNADGTVLTEVIHSVESRVALESEDGEDYEVNVNFMKFADSARTYLHNKIK